MDLCFNIYYVMSMYIQMFLFTFTVTVADPGEISSVTFWLKDSAVLKGQAILGESKTASRTACAKECSRVKACTTLAYNKASRRCLLYDATQYSQLEYKNDWQLYTMLPLIGATLTPCPDGWYAFKTSCYKRFDDRFKKNFHKAEEHCQQLKGHLVVIDDATEEEFLKSHIKSSGVTSAYDQMWLGAKRDTTIDNVVRWIQCNNVITTPQYYLPDQPSKMQFYDCLVMEIDVNQSSRFGLWETYECYYKRSYYCELLRVNVSCSTTGL
ncbi:unnamed protein product [Owenia fusiformis]|uniref:Uncharacterized protein n=1 Tax=Owenia fusiformis TaxID=6347 RepID=A0A8J1UVK8_OWEFU|nr:unnamed protein product [Owenia fusiformis]